VPHDELVVKFKQWAAAGGPCPEGGRTDGQADGRSGIKEEEG
jgi:hypothetical protein